MDEHVKPGFAGILSHDVRGGQVEQGSLHQASSIKAFTFLGTKLLYELV